ncbi:DUF3422 domain-containing protein [Planktomarina sp.]|jgi:uncharacterized membrane-anchored protein|nr:DUF3422 domain-containing protein [Planktomarina sp.]MDB4841374.1 DUF3422 domain-containing protein [Planktomarina sp.]
MAQLIDHPLRHATASELHARPFPHILAPARAAFFAYTSAQNDSGRREAADREHFLRLLDHYGVVHPSETESHFFGQLGEVWVKWECHTEFVTYTAFVDGLGDLAFDGSESSIFPAAWQAALPGTTLSSTSIRVEEDQDTQSIKNKLEDWFVSESLAASRVLDSAAVIAGDYRMDDNGNMRFAVFVPASTGRRRVGRIVQRINEIEVYKTMSMLGLMRARDLSVELNSVDTNLSALVADLADDKVPAEDNLNGLLKLSADLERHSAAVAYRFSASKAYAAIVAQRIEVLREAQFEGRQTFREFMMRRFDPAMRTVQALDSRLQDLISRAIRTGDLLRTRVDVERQTQNQELLSSMNRRADAQLRLQKTVEGLSVVAISYYATGLSLYVLAPFSGLIGISKAVLTAAVVPLVVCSVYLTLRQIRKRIVH